jgi:hypothetical protein
VNTKMPSEARPGLLGLMNAKALHHRTEDLGTGLTAIARTGTREAGEGVFTTALHSEAAHSGSVSEGEDQRIGRRAAPSREIA